MPYGMEKEQTEIYTIISLALFFGFSLLFQQPKHYFSFGSKVICSLAILDVPKSDAIVVLGLMVNNLTRQQVVELTLSCDRLTDSILLLNGGRLKRLFLLVDLESYFLKVNQKRARAVISSILWCARMKKEFFFRRSIPTLIKMLFSPNPFSKKKDTKYNSSYISISYETCPQRVFQSRDSSSSLPYRLSHPSGGCQQLGMLMFLRWEPWILLPSQSKNGLE